MASESTEVFVWGFGSGVAGCEAKRSFGLNTLPIGPIVVPFGDFLIGFYIWEYPKWGDHFEERARNSRIRKKGRGTQGHRRRR